MKRLKNKIREITSRKKPYPLAYRIKKLNQYLMGWCSYFALADTPSVFIKFDSWIRRRLSMCIWKAWKLPRTKVRKLTGLGIPKGKAYVWGTHGRVTGEFLIALYYIEPSIIPTGIIKGSKVYHHVTKFCVINLN